MINDADDYLYIGYDYTVFFYFIVICEESRESMIEIKPCECVDMPKN